ncbi:TetR/AcrR family transcriptional regulator [Allobranchiibius sp. CTAmp26]|uniref:TetR/AcrR family transcriptional regulator n=1 Tax=Allobranchiibius sp. CTAmp26 TaxID=2815214 RepID=UPI001AA0F966|nr:TetR/AcrR family transcriptional regulator [Allobranchiibius sp. CTAmp26]MBO1756419.1 TetR family transcriptional regulator [Allobranchiibius sp. CTAmp26]
MSAAIPEPPARAARDRLLDAARTSFADKGFHGTTTRDIAAAAGMSPAAVYVHHRTKESLLHELSLEGHRATMASLDAAVRDCPDDPVTLLHAWVTAFVTGHALGHTTARIVNYELEALTPEHRAEVEHWRSRIQESLIDILERGCGAGVFAVDTHVAASAIAGMGVDVARWFRDDAGTTATDLAREFADLAVRMVRA